MKISLTNSILPGYIILLVFGCQNQSEYERIVEFGEKYTLAWNSQKPENVASFYAPEGSLTVNNGSPIIGRDELTDFAKSFMVSFPDMKLTMDSIVLDSETYRYHWTFAGTNTGPDGTGNKVVFSGFERWTLDDDGLIQKSIGTFDAEDYNRQLGSQTKTIDMVEVRKLIESKVTQFSQDFNNGDSLGLANYYATDGTFGSIKGKELISAWGGMIRTAVKNGTEVKFTTKSIFYDDELLIETGIFEFIDNDEVVKSQGKYMLVWKQENGEWKIYRDIGL